MQDYIIGLGKGRELLTEIVEILRSILVMPATNATSKRSFSVLRRVKTYLRSTMSQSQLNRLMTLAILKEMTDELDLVECAKEFVSETNTGFLYLVDFHSW